MSIQAAGAAQPTTFQLGASVRLATDDPRRRLIGKSPAELAPSGSGALEVLTSVHGALRGARTLSLADLPPEIAAMVLESRAKSAEIILTTWAESIREQAELDKKASERSRLKQQHQSGIERERQLFASVARSLANRGVVSAATASEALASAGAAQIQPEPESVAAARAIVRDDVPPTRVEGLAPPTSRR